MNKKTLLLAGGVLVVAVIAVISAQGNLTGDIIEPLHNKSVQRW